MLTMVLNNAIAFRLINDPMCHTKTSCSSIYLIDIFDVERITVRPDVYH